MNPEENTNQKPIKALRTYAGDVEEALNKTKSSAATIMLAEEKRREEKPEMAPARRQASTEKNRLYLVLSSVMIFLAISVVGTVYYFKSNQKIQVQEEAKALVTFNQESKVLVASSTRESLVQRILSDRNTFTMPANSVLYINTSDASGDPIPAEMFLSKISPHIPGDLARAFDGKYMFGMLSYDTNAAFMILKTSSYDIAYSGMLRWEKGMIDDLGRIFSLPENMMGTEASFVDEEFNNRDLRVLRDNDGKQVLLYTFLDKNTVIITVNNNDLKAIIEKYTLTQQTK